MATMTVTMTEAHTPRTIFSNFHTNSNKIVHSPHEEKFSDPQARAEAEEEAAAAAEAEASAAYNENSHQHMNQRNLRRGKWTTEEERYVEKVINDFNTGLLDAPQGTTLRNYLSEKLQCDPMRITKKYTGQNSIGKRVFHPVSIDGDHNQEARAAVQRAKAETAALEAQWKQKLHDQAREQAEAINAKRKAHEASVFHKGTTYTAEHNKRRRLEPADAKRCASWLVTARALLDDEAIPPTPELIPDIEQVIQSGHELRAHLNSRRSTFLTSAHPTTSQRSHNYDQQQYTTKQDHAFLATDDKEATNLLVDFLRSAQRTLHSTTNHN